MSVSIAIGSVMKNYRVANSKFGTLVDKELGVSKQCLYQWENGQTSVSVDSFISWCRVLGLDPLTALKMALNASNG